MPSRGRWIARYLAWPIAGLLLATLFESIRSIGTSGDGFEAAIPFVGLAAGALIGVPACISPAALDWPDDAGTARIVWPLGGLLLGGSIRGVMGWQADEIAVSTTVAVAVGTAAVMLFALMTLLELDGEFDRNVDGAGADGVAPRGDVGAHTASNARARCRVRRDRRRVCRR